MKSIANWLVLVVFALQASGMVWFAHLGQCSGPAQEPSCRCGHDHSGALPVFARDIAGSVGHHPASGSKPAPHHHDTQQCGVCQLLLTLVATQEIPPALPAVAELAFGQPAAWDQPSAQTFPSTLDARGPPATTL